MIGRTCLEGWCDSILTFSFPSSSCLTSWGISKHLTISVQDFRDFFSPPQVPSSFLCFLFHNPRKREDPTPPPSLSTFSFLPLGLATLSRPQLSPAPDFPVPGSGWASALGVVVRTLAGSQNVP